MKRRMLRICLVCLALFPGSADASDVAAGLAYHTLNGTIERGISRWQQSADRPLWLRDAELEVRLEEGLRPAFSFAALIPLSPAGKEADTWFVQGRIAKGSDDPWRTSVGIGWRSLSKNNNRMIGLNVFGDREWRHERTKWGIGAEYFWSRYEARFNWYAPIGRPVEYCEDGMLWRESVLGGYDAEVGTALPRMPWLKLYVRGGAHSGGSSGAESEWMFRSVLQISSRLAIDFGYRFGSGRSGDLTIAFSYQIGKEQAPAMLEKGKPVFRKDGAVEDNLKDKRFVKVARDWTIHVDRVIISPPAAVLPEGSTTPPETPVQAGRVSVNIERGN